MKRISKVVSVVLTALLIMSQLCCVAFAAGEQAEVAITSNVDGYAIITNKIGSDGTHADVEGTYVDGGVIAFELNNLPENTAGLKLIVSTDNGQLSGDFTVDINSTNPPVISTVEDYGESEVVIMFNTGENQTTAYVYLPVPTGNVGNILAIIKNGDRQIGMGAWDNVSIARTAIRRAVIGKKTIIGGSDDK